MKSVSIAIVGTTTSIPTRKISRTNIIGIPTDIIMGGVVTVIDDRQTIAEDSMGLGQMDTISSIGTNVVITKVPKMSGIRRHIENPDNHHGITGGFSKTGMSKQ